MAAVSIVTLTRNRPAYLPKALRSAGAQTHPELELVLYQDGGNPLLDDASYDVIEELEFPVIHAGHKDVSKGVARSRNEAIGMTRGDAIAILDDDDLWDPGHVAHLAALLDRDPKVDVAYSDVRLQREYDGAERVIARDFDLEVFSKDDYIPPSSMIVRRAAFDRFGLFDPEFTCSEDWDWLMRVVRGGGVIARDPGITATVVIHDGGQSSIPPGRLEVRKRELQMLRDRYGLGPITPKTFWEVAATVCPGSVTTS
jgi:glycosyltransferase involved in cell wall biosynthesis